MTCRRAAHSLPGLLFHCLYCACIHALRMTREETGNMHAPEREDDALHTLHDECAPAQAATPLANKRSHVTDGSVGGSSGKRPLVGVTLEQNDLLGELERFRQGDAPTWPTIEEVVAVTGYSRRAVRRMVAALTRVGLVAIGVRGEVVVLGKPAGLFFASRRDISTRDAKPVAATQCAPAQVAT